jgi:hypothetical protein
MLLSTCGDALSSVLSTRKCMEGEHLEVGCWTTSLWVACRPGVTANKKKKGSSGSVTREFEVCGRAGSSSIRVDRIWFMPIRSCGSCQHKQEQIAAKKRRGRAACSSYKTHTWNQAPTTHRHKNTHARNTRESEFQNLIFQLQLLDLSAACTRSRYEFARCGNNKLRQLAL